MRSSGCVSSLKLCSPRCKWGRGLFCSCASDADRACSIYRAMSLVHPLDGTLSLSCPLCGPLMRANRARRPLSLFLFLNLFCRRDRYPYLSPQRRLVEPRGKRRGLSLRQAASFRIHDSLRSWASLVVDFNRIARSRGWNRCLRFVSFGPQVWSWWWVKWGFC